MLLASVLPGLLAQTPSYFTKPFHKIGFDMSRIGIQWETAYITETTKIAYDKAGTEVNVAVWNMHIPEDHHFDDTIESALTPTGKGGAFRIVVSCGNEYLRNDGALGPDNRRCSGRVVQIGNFATFERTQKKPTPSANNYFYEMPELLQWVL